MRLRRSQMRRRRKLYKHTRADQQRQAGLAPGGAGWHWGAPRPPGQIRHGKTHQNHELFGAKIVINTPWRKRNTLIRSDRKNKTFIFCNFHTPAPAAGGRRPTNLDFAGLAPKESLPSRARTASHARTHAAQPQPKPKSISRLSTPLNLQYIHTYTCVFYVDLHQSL